MVATAPAETTINIDVDGPRPSPRENFFLHANWEWLHEHELPASESSWGTFNILSDVTIERLRAICEEVQDRPDAPRGSVTQIVRDFYRSGMDMDRRGEQGLEPLAGLLGSISRIESAEDLAAVLAALHLVDVDPFFQIWVAEDFKRPGRNVLYIEQGGLGMPNRDYYLDDDKAEMRDAYRAYITRIFRLTGADQSEAEEATAAVLRIERALADASLPQAEVRQVDKNYHRYTVARLKEQMPQLSWDVYFRNLGIPTIPSLVVRQPAFLATSVNLLAAESLQDIKRYLTFSLINGYADTLGQAFVDLSFSFHDQTLQGQREPRPLWKNILRRTQWTPLTNALGPLYAERYFSAEDKARVIELVGYIKEAFAARVERLEWMSDATKQLTLEKLANITFKMGYPDTWIDLSTLDIGDIYATNVMRTAEFEKRRKLAQLDQPFDRSEWRMPPTLVNAMSDLKREMTFPMAILQPPFFDSSADDASNYGAIGFIIGHELTHFFDDQGSKFDVDGKLHTWWSKEDAQAFRSGSQKFIVHYGRYSVEGVKVNPELTLGENIADVGGVAIAFDAFQRHLAAAPQPPSENGLTANQRFFLANGQVWAIRMSHEQRVLRSKVDPHAPGEVRVNGTLSATPQFYDTFDVREGDGMFTPPEERPALW